jgi:hypothetical protein
MSWRLATRLSVVVLALLVVLLVAVVSLRTLSSGQSLPSGSLWTRDFVSF